MFVFTLYSFFGGKEKEEDNIEDMFDRGEESSDDFDIEDLDIDSNNNDEDSDEPDEVDVESEEDLDIQENDDLVFEDEIEVDDEFNYEQIYKDEFGDEEIEKVLSDTEKVMEAYVKGSIGDKKYFTSSYAKKVSKEAKSNDIAGVEDIDVFATQQEVDGEITIGSIVESANGIEHFNLVFVEEDGKFLVDNIVSIWSN